MTVFATGGTMVETGLRSDCGTTSNSPKGKHVKCGANGPALLRWRRVEIESGLHNTLAPTAQETAERSCQISLFWAPLTRDCTSAQSGGSRAVPKIIGHSMTSPNGHTALGLSTAASQLFNSGPVRVIFFGRGMKTSWEKK